MTLELFEKAEEIVKEIDNIDMEMGKVLAIKKEIDENAAMRVFSPVRSYVVDPCGLLPKFLEEIVDVLQEKRDKLMEELAML